MLIRAHWKHALQARGPWFSASKQGIAAFARGDPPAAVQGWAAFAHWFIAR